MARAKMTFSTSIAESLHGAMADTATKASCGLSSAISLLEASLERRSTSARPSASVGMPCFSKRASIAPPTKLPEPITTTRAGLRGEGFRCSSIRCAPEGVHLQACLARFLAVEDAVGVERDPALHRPRDVRGRDLAVLRPGCEDHQGVGAARRLERVL